jgi:hypothetical protein
MGCFLSLSIFIKQKKEVIDRRDDNINRLGFFFSLIQSKNEKKKKKEMKPSIKNEKK